MKLNNLAAIAGAIILSASTAEACLQRPVEVTLKDTSFDANPVNVSASRIRFGTGAAAVEFKYDSLARKWCFRSSRLAEAPEAGCASTDSGQPFSFLLRNSRGQVYAQVTLEDRYLVARPLNARAKSLTFSSAKEGLVDRMNVWGSLCDNAKFMGCAGSSLEIINNPLLKSLNTPGLDVTEALDLGSEERERWETNLCGPPLRLQNDDQIRPYKMDGAEAYR